MTRKATVLTLHLQILFVDYCNSKRETYEDTFIMFQPDIILFIALY